MPLTITCLSHQANAQIRANDIVRFQIGEEYPAFDVIQVNCVCRRVEDLPQDPNFITGDATFLNRSPQNPRIFEANWVSIPPSMPGQTINVGLRVWATVRMVGGNVTVPLTVTTPPMG